MNWYYFCHVCGKSFETQKDLDNHLKKLHTKKDMISFLRKGRLRVNE